MSTQCQYDTGSMYGCQPACSQASTGVFVYRVPCYGEFKVNLYDRHVQSMAGRVFPSRWVFERPGWSSGRPLHPVVAAELASRQAVAS